MSPLNVLIRESKSSRLSVSDVWFSLSRRNSNEDGISPDRCFLQVQELSRLFTQHALSTQLPVDFLLHKRGLWGVLLTDVQVQSAGPVAARYPPTLLFWSLYLTTSKTLRQQGFKRLSFILTNSNNKTVICLLSIKTQKAKPSLLMLFNVSVPSDRCEGLTWEQTKIKTMDLVTDLASLWRT